MREVASKRNRGPSAGHRLVTLVGDFFLFSEWVIRKFQHNKLLQTKITVFVVYRSCCWHCFDKVPIRGHILHNKTHFERALPPEKTLEEGMDWCNAKGGCFLSAGFCVWGGSGLLCSVHFLLKADWLNVGTQSCGHDCGKCPCSLNSIQPF